MTGVKEAAPLWYSGLGRSRRRCTGRLWQIQICFTKTVDLKGQAVVLVGLADPFHAYSPRSSHSAMIARPHDGQDLPDTDICECLMGPRMTGFCAVAVTPQRRCNLPSDLEIGAAGWKWKQCHSPDQVARVSIGDRPSAQGQSGCVALGDPRAQELAHVRLVGDQRQRRTQPTRNLRRSVYPIGGEVVVELPRTQYEPGRQDASRVRVPFDVAMLNHVASYSCGYTYRKKSPQLQDTHLVRVWSASD